MLKKVVSVHPVSAQSGMVRLGGLGAPPRGETEGWGPAEALGRFSRPASVQGRGRAQPTVRLARTSQGGPRGAQRRQHPGRPASPCPTSWPQTLRGTKRDKGMGVTGGAPDRAEERQVRYEVAQLHPRAVKQPTSLHCCDQEHRSQQIVPGHTHILTRTCGGPENTTGFLSNRLMTTSPDIGNSSVKRGTGPVHLLPPGRQVLTNLYWLGSPGGRAHHFLYLQHRGQGRGHCGESPDFSPLLAHGTCEA